MDSECLHDLCQDVRAFDFDDLSTELRQDTIRSLGQSGLHLGQEATPDRRRRFLVAIAPHGRLFRAA